MSGMWHGCEIGVNMRKNSELTILISGCLAMIITVVFYLLAFDHIFALPMRWLSLCFLLITEVAGTIKTLKIDKNIFGVTSIIVSAVHILAVLVLALVFVNFMPLLMKQYVLLNVLGFAVVAVVDFLLLNLGAKAEKENQKYADYTDVLHACYMKSKDLAHRYRTSEYVKELQKISEWLKYSDHTELWGNEDDIFLKLNELEDILRKGEKEAMKTALVEIENLIKLRSIHVRNEKRGRF